ncbi:signal peptidase II [Anaerocolumna xylanovorans]|uniref:Signal peptidase (SPase) II n=1 Tax=Anaerocolumna xylanovorans DSM 12503 TaxID=1121345 RepID=A0A1M7YK38_9FIRM|nr:signal peptidase II [Anaerocolumna xylanovorans]SHO52984.1 Signal peptidase (SPase) II [Anaerocolumna xylanovorans DSM 12503]
MRKKIIVFGALISIDQLLKGIVYYTLMGADYRTANGKLGFFPYMNKDQLSVFNNELNMNLSLGILLIINIISIIALVLIYILFKKREYTDRYFDYAILIMEAGCVCSLADKLLYQGSLDYLLAGNKICDAKDIYLGAGIVLFCIYLYYYGRHKRNSAHTG